ncbi:MAG: ADP-ribose pyrophosphatase [Chlamydiales bacterium]|nr:ADP-ribose pyrophosphatase [Chlamydiales bacterium]MCH9619152.1 ADP-ribose pyrophosphatase [Chlamydiales bacterium]MCH9622414.1 ADP-ribose pyrophosphatase [Chlamydiales bacterium]
MLNDLPKVTEEKIVYDNYLKIKEEQLEIPNQDDYTYYSLLTCPVAVMVLATTADGRYLINREYRHPTGKILLSCPGGLPNEGEEMMECAKRELLEETGYTATRFEKMGESHPFPGICNQKTFFVRAYEAQKTGALNLDHAELIETSLLSQKELFNAMDRGEPLDGLLCSALFFEMKGHTM